MSWFTDLVSSGTSTIVSSLGDAIDKNVTSDEEKMILKNELKKIEEDSKVKEKELEIEADKIMQKNTADARAMQVEALKQDDVYSKRFVSYLAIFWSMVSTIYLFSITFMDIPEQSVRFADTILGFLLGTIVATIINFFFGSSKGNEDKAEIQNKSIKT